MRMSSRLRRLGSCSSRACSAQATLARDLSVRGRRRGGGGGQRMAHMGEPEAEGCRRVAPLLPGVQAAAGNRLQTATAHPVWGRRREGTVRRVCDVAPRHCAKLYPLRGARGRRRDYPGGGGGGAVQA